KANLSGANLSHANLSEADLSEANLTKANLTKANLTKANLTRANLTKADLSGTDINEALLRDAKLQHADMSAVKGLQVEQFGGADISSVKLPSDKKCFKGPLKRVSDASILAKGIFFAIIPACIYFILTISPTKDVDLITNSTLTQLPMIKVPIPIVGFYVAGPIFLLALYVGLHICLQRLCESLTDLPAVFPDGSRLNTKVEPLISARLAQRYFSRLQDNLPQFAKFHDFLLLLLAWYFTPVTAGFFWFKSLVKHDMLITGFYVVILTIFIGAGIKFFVIARSTLKGMPKEKLFDLLMRRSRVKHLGVCVLIGFILLSASAFGTGKFGPWRWKSLVNANMNDTDISVKPPNWTGTDTREMDLVIGARLSGKDLRYMQASGAFLVEADLNGAELSNANLSNADIRGANLRRAKLMHANLSMAKLRNVNKKADLSEEIHNKKTDLSDANLSETDLSDADLNGAILVDAILIKAHLYRVILIEANLSKAKLIDAILSKADLSKAILCDANLSRAMLIDADLCEANLSRADLYGASLIDANLKLADLRMANLSRASLKNIKNYKSIISLKDTNIYGVRDAPDGFVEWAIETMGAVSYDLSVEWHKYLESQKAPPASTTETEDPKG
ncbi:pentapeptide repeat-containing protein, partial [Candidatus Pacearchaeota archaeon]|nr:pentapeptide repeat-containing protein [Candidatus Pacearchaeota archaeon]